MLFHYYRCESSFFSTHNTLCLGMEYRPWNETYDFIYNPQYNLAGQFRRLDACKWRKSKQLFYVPFKLIHMNYKFLAGVFAKLCTFFRCEAFFFCCYCCFNSCYIHSLGMADIDPSFSNHSFRESNGYNVK